MASFSRTPSPEAVSGSESDFSVATPITPRTKLRQLFATIDGDGDSSSDSNCEQKDAGEITTPSRKAAKINTDSAIKVPCDKGTSAGRSPRTSPRVGAGGLLSSSEEDSDIEVRPRGRFAARMQAAALAAAKSSTIITDPSSTEPELRTENARERVKRMLFQQAAEGEKEQVEGDTNNDAEDEEYDAPLTAASRPRKRFTNLRSLRRSPTVSPQRSTETPRSVRRKGSPSISMTPTKNTEREASLDLFMTPRTADARDEDSTVAAKPKPSHNARFQALVSRKREEARARKEAEERKRAARKPLVAANDDDDDSDINSEVSAGGLDEDDDLLLRDAEGVDDNPWDITDDEGGRKLTQTLASSRPERKASKRALEEMHRETQRMTRDLQLTHEARTRKRVTKASLFERFNFLPTSTAAVAAIPKLDVPTNSSRPTSPVSPHNNTDNEMRTISDTPPSSPPVPVITDAADKYLLATIEAEETTSTPLRLDKGKHKLINSTNTLDFQQQSKPVRVLMPLMQANLVTTGSDDDDELEIMRTSKRKLDQLFENAPLKHNKEPRSMLILRRLAQVGSPGKTTAARPTTNGDKAVSLTADLTLGELQLSLQDRARLQAKRDRNERQEMLRAKGVRIQTEEEREREMDEVDDIVARARLEAEELMQREREEAKKNKKKVANGEIVAADADPLDWDESEDDDYEEEEEEDGGDEEERDIELSGSEDENSVAGEDVGEEGVAGNLIDGEAESTDNDSQEEKDDVEAKENEAEAAKLPAPPRIRPTKRRTALVITDDEDDDENNGSVNDNSNTPDFALTLPSFEAKTPGPRMPFTKSPFGLTASSDSPDAPTSVLRSATKPFIPGLPVAVGDAAGLGLTQIFAGTMADDSQMMAGSPSQLMSTLGNLVDADMSQATAVSVAAVPDSQLTQAWIKRMRGGCAGTDAAKDGINTDTGANGTTDVSQLVQFSFSQSQLHGLDSLLQEQSQRTDLYYPSQDADPQEYTPLKVRFIDHQPSTMETVILGQPSQQSLEATQVSTQPSQALLSSLPTASTHPRGRLLRKSDMAKISDAAGKEREEADEEAEEEVEAASAFAKLKQASAQKLFDRKKSKAKEMIEEQAEESEDEYAGLGGADGEDSDNESLASVQDMIDDQRVSSADGAKLAAFYADRERENDEKQVEKLFRDVTTGMLRRKRGAGGAGDYDLSDSDDGGEARRRMKRRQFARMQKALFSDERVSKVASNPRNQAFLRTIEDRGSDDEMDLIVDAPTDTTTATMASTASPAVDTSDSITAPVNTNMSIPDSQPSAVAGVQQIQQPLTNPRRRRLPATNSKKPANIGEIRESLSSLLDDYHNDGSNLSTVADSEFGSGDEEDDQAAANKENQSLSAAITTVPGTALMRRSGRSQNVQVVDRITLRRSSSTMSFASASSTGTGAEAASKSSHSLGATSGGAGPYIGPAGFRVPALLRRATTNSLMSNGSSTSNSSSANSSRTGFDKAGGTLDNGKIKKNATKMSGIHSFARENERRVALVESDKRRQAKKAKSAETRSRAVGNLFGAGKFE
ncbi:hypothetical protein SEPCBS57363_004874 [Sporothrix epigloea]|uniref:DNA replication checkpoint mediator MRC1 domain-containing protein n=1 Tax=Sporothrix epigloea TaxID=1892477 RepID=A0ABP0DXB5_9PEZI